MIVVDVGALDIIKWSGHTVYLLQPEPKNYIWLVNKVINSKRKYVTPLNIALSNKTGVQRLWIRDEPMGHSLKERKLEPIIGSIVVATLTWDDFVKLHNIWSVDVCFIDVEGSEEDILEGMTTVMPERLIVSHYHSTKFKDVKTCEELQKDLIEMGYKIVEVGKEEIVAIKK